MPDNHHIDDMAKQQLSGLEPTFDAQDWSAMEALLNKEQRRPIIWWRWVGVAAAFTGIVLALVWLNRSMPIAPTVAEQTAPAAPDRSSDAQEKPIGQAPFSADQGQSDEPIEQLLPAAGSDTGLPSAAKQTTEPSAEQNKPLHWLANEVEAAEETMHMSLTPTASTSYSPGDEGLLPPYTSESTVLASQPIPKQAAALPGDVDRVSSLGLLEKYAAIPLAPTKHNRMALPEDPLGRQTADAKSRFVQPFVGVYSMAHRYSRLDRKYSYAYGIRGGVELWNDFSVEIGLGYHQIEYTEAGDHDTISHRVHLATEGSFHHLEVPTLITYHFNGNASWDGFVTVGLRHLFVQKEQYHFHYRNLPTSNIPASSFSMDTIITLDVTNSTRMQQEDLQQMGLSAAGQISYSDGPASTYRALGYLGAGVAYHLSPGVTLEGGLQYQFSLQPLGVEARDLEALGLSVGLKYRL